MTLRLSVSFILSILLSTYSNAQSNYDSTQLVFTKRVKGNISPKSIVYGQNKLFAQNMMYKHTITIYDTSGTLLKTIKDTISPRLYGDTVKLNTYEGSPVEACLSADKKYMWVSNYQMFGKDFKKPGCDACNKSSGYDHSYLYAVNTQTLTVDKIAKTGSVPKFVATSSDGLLLAVSNWSDGTVTILNQYDGTFIKNIKVGRHPRGITFNKNDTKMYVAIMGADNLIEINIGSGEVITHKQIGDGPRHLLYADSCLYITLNNEKKIKKWDLRSNKWSTTTVGSQPRSMSFSTDSSYLYVVNYNSSTMSKVSTSDMKVIQTIKTDGKPIGITVEPTKNIVWVACYGGTLLRYDEKKVKTPTIATDQFYTYNIIIGSFTSFTEARTYAIRMINRGHEAIVLPLRNNRYRVSGFQSNDISEASTQLKSLKKIRRDAWLLRL